MKTIIRLDVSDTQRQALASLIAGKPVKRLASRDDVASFVLGMMGGLLRERPEEAPTPEAAATVRAVRGALTPEEEACAARLRAEGKDEGFIRGWIAASRKFFGGRLTA